MSLGVALLCGGAVPAHRFFQIFLHPGPFDITATYVALGGGGALLCRGAPPPGCRSRIFHHTDATGVAIPQTQLRPHMTGCCRGLIPAHGFGVVLRHAQTGLAAHTHGVAGFGVALFGRALFAAQCFGQYFAPGRVDALGSSLVEPLGRHGYILGYTPTMGVAQSQIILGGGVSLLGGFLVPMSRCRCILFRPCSLLVAHAQVVLRGGVALLGCGFVPAHGFFLLLLDALSRLVAQPQIVLSCGVTLRGCFQILRLGCGGITRPTQASQTQHEHCSAYGCFHRQYQANSAIEPCYIKRKRRVK